MTRTIDQMIASEVLCCMSSLVATLAAGYGSIASSGATTHNIVPAAELAALAEKSFELAAPVDDWEEAAIQVGWSKTPSSFLQTGTKAVHFLPDWRTLCEAENIEPYAREVYEHWAVTDWFADKLEAAGEKVDRDFAGLCVWARTTTGQSMTMDGVIQRIYAQTHTGLEG